MTALALRHSWRASACGIFPPPLRRARRVTFSCVSRRIREIRLRRLQGQLGEVAYQITKVHFSNFQDPEPVWRPAVNIFQCDNSLRV